MENYYNNGPDGMPRVKRMTDSTLNCIIRDSLFSIFDSFEGEDRDRLYGLMHDTAEEVLARVPAWPAAAQPAQGVGLTVDQCTDAVLHLIHGTHDLNWFDNNDGDGFSSDEHEFRHLREKLSAILARQTAPTAVQQGDTDDERREAWKNGYSAGFAATQRIYAEEIDVRHKFEMWKSNRGESAIYEGDGRYNNVGVTEQFEAFAAGVEVGCAADRPAANAADVQLLPVLRREDRRAVCRQPGGVIMEEKNNTPNKLDFISKFRAQYQVPKNVPNEMVEFFPSFEHAWAGWCMACPSQPTQSVGLTDEQRRIAVELLACFNSWEDDVRVLGNVRAADAANLLSAILARQAAPTPERTVLANIVGEVSHTVGGDCVFFVEKTDAIRVLKRGDRLSIVARSAPTLDSAQQGEDWTDEQIAAYDRAMCETAQQGEDEPPLPEPAVDRHPMGATQDYYTAYQMRQYGDARAAHAVAHMMRKLGDGVSIDTPEFRKLDAAYARAFFEWEDSPSEKTGWNLGNARRDLIAHINAKLAQARAAGGKPESEKIADVIAHLLGEGAMDWHAGPTGDSEDDAFHSDDEERATIIDLVNKAIAARAAGAERAVPEGWTIKRVDNGTIIVRKDDVGGCATRQGDPDVVLAVLWALANDLLAAPSPAAAKEGWKPLADDDKPDVTRKIDVVLTNGVTLENGDYRKIDWTQVRNWRYSPTQQTSAKVDAEGGA